MKYRLLALAIFLILVLLCACTPEHTHSFADGFSSDETHHWHQCECKEKDGYEEHTFGEGKIILFPTTEREGQMAYVCTVCSYKKVEPVERLAESHTHEFSAEAIDGYRHKLVCICGEEGKTSEHTWDEGEITTPAGEYDTGIRTFSCTECGHKYTENIPSNIENGLSFLQSTHYRLSDKLHAAPLTIEAEICVDPSHSGRAGAIFGNYYGIRQDYLLEIYENGVPRFYYSDNAGNVRDLRFTNVDVRTGDFVHIALTFDFEEGMISFYLNGEVAEVLRCEFDLASDVTRYQFVLGGDNRSNNGNYFKGQIRSVSAYSDVRTADEIAHSAEHGTNLYADDLILSYLLNKNSGGKDINDLSGNGYIIQQEWLDSHEPSIDYAYSFAVVGDTQWLSRYKPEKMEALYDWLLANKDAKKIAHVFGLGDITDAWNTADKENEWIRAYEYISKLDGVIPYSLIRGNHDESKYFLKYFATDDYMSQFDGFMIEGDIRNSYREFTVGSVNYLFLTLDYGASDEMLAWANEVVASHPDHRVIITTHAYHGYDGGHLSSDNVPSSGNITINTDVDTSVGNNNRGYNNGQEIWEKLVSLHPNIFLVMSGHTPLEDVFVLQSEGIHGNTVTQMLIDPQWMDPQKDGTGMVCMLYFSEDGTEMEVEWICTDNGKYYKEQNQFSIDFTDCLTGTPHNFSTFYNESCHYLKCECGYIHKESAHELDGGVLNPDGLMEYTCACGYKKITSVSEDPVALELQTLLGGYYNGGRYYISTLIGGVKTTTFFDGTRFFGADDDGYTLTDGYITLYDLLMGKQGNLRLDLGWSVYNGVYSSANADVLKGVYMLATLTKDAEPSDITKVTVEQDGSLLLIRLWAGDSVAVETSAGRYATATLINCDGSSLGVKYAAAGSDGLCRFTLPEISGLVPEYEYLILSVKSGSLEATVHYSEIDVWDGKSVSESLNGSGTKEDPYLISSGADLAYIAKVVNDAAASTANFKGVYFRMTKSIDLGGHELLIGSYSADKAFHGYFDGDHHAIKGINGSQSLFGILKDGYIKSLSLYGQVTTSEKKGVAGLVSYISNATVENVTNFVNVTGIQQAAGIVGWLENSAASSVMNCVNYGTIKATSYQIGGIAGFAKGNISGCVNFGNVSSSGSGYVGGIGGSANDAKGTRSVCVNYGNVSGTDFVGGVFGLINKATNDCYSYGTVTSGGKNVGDVVGGGESYLVYAE